MVYRVIGIDVGWSNLAMVVVDVDTDSIKNFNVIYTNMTDLRKIKCSDPSCCMFEKRDRKGGHLVHHYVEMHHEWFSTSDRVVIESQPIMSTHKDVEQLILVYIKQRYSNGNKKHVSLVAPQSMHSHFNMSNEKVIRRLQVVEITRQYLETSSSFINAEHKDHLGDAMAFVLYFINTKLEDYLNSLLPNPFMSYTYNTKCTSNKKCL